MGHRVVRHRVVRHRDNQDSQALVVVEERKIEMGDILGILAVGHDLALGGCQLEGLLCHRWVGFTTSIHWTTIHFTFYHFIQKNNTRNIADLGEDQFSLKKD